MKKLIFLIFMAVACQADAQTMYRTFNQMEADMFIWVTEDRNEADRIVYVTQYPQEAKLCCVWYFTEYIQEAKTVLYFSDYRGHEDEIVYFTNDLNEAKYIGRE